MKLAEMKARASQAATAGLRMKLWRVSAELRQKASADPSELNLPPDSTTVSFPGIYYLDPADKNKQRKKRPFCNAIKPQLPICFCPLKELITW